MRDKPERSEEPPDTELGRLSADMIALIEGHEGVTGIVMLHKGDEGMTALCGYDEDGDVGAMADLIIYLRAMMEAHGQQMVIIPMEFPQS